MYRSEGFNIPNPIINVELTRHNSSNCDRKSIASESGGSEGTTDLLLGPSRADAPETPNLDSIRNDSEHTSPQRSERTPSANTSEGTDNSEHANGQLPPLSRQFEPSSEAAASLGPSIANDPSVGESLHALTHLQGASITPEECTSPRNSAMIGSCQGTSAMCVGGLPSHVYSPLSLAGGPGVPVRDDRPTNVPCQESIAATGSERRDNDATHTNLTPIEATWEVGPNYMAGPNSSSFATGPRPLPEHVQNVSQQWNNRANQSDFRRLEDSIGASTNVEPNNDAPLTIQRQRSNL